MKKDFSCSQFVILDNLFKIAGNKTYNSNDSFAFDIWDANFDKQIVVLFLVAKLIVEVLFMLFSVCNRLKISILA